LKVRFLDAMTAPKTLSDGTNPPIVVEASQNHHLWYED
jgi:hypothetical protein